MVNPPLLGLHFLVSEISITYITCYIQCIWIKCHIRVLKICIKTYLAKTWQINHERTSFNTSKNADSEGYPVNDVPLNCSKAGVSTCSKCQKQDFFYSIWIFQVITQSIILQVLTGGAFWGVLVLMLIISKQLMWPKPNLQLINSIKVLLWEWRILILLSSVFIHLKCKYSLLSASLLWDLLFSYSFTKKMRQWWGKDTLSQTLHNEEMQHAW